jgi:hypothetical protein
MEAAMTRKLLAVLIGILAPSWAGAAEWYLGGGIGEKVTAGEVSRPLEEFGVRAPDESRKIYAGAELGKILAVEGAYYDFGDRVCCPQLADAGFATSLQGVALAAVGRLPLPVPRLQIFAKGGVLFWEEEGDEITIAGPIAVSVDGSDPIFGVGASIRLAGPLRVRAEWETFDLGEDSGDSLWLLVEVRF